MDIELLLFLLCVFLATLSLVIAGISYYQRSGSEDAKLLRQRMRFEQAALTPVDLPRSLLKQRPFASHPQLDAWLQQLPLARWLDQLIQQTGHDFRLDRLLQVQGGLALLLALILHAALGWFWISLAGLLTGGAAPLLWLQQQKDKRLKQIESQLPEALDLMSRALRAGHSFSSALNMVSSEGPQPIAGEFRQTFEEINFGLSAQEALIHLAGRVPSTDLRYFVIAVLIQRESGGNLSELLDNLSHIMRERLRLLGTIRTLSAEGKLSAWILTLLPFGVAFMMHTMNPGFLSILWTDEMGLRLLVGAGVAMVLGVFWMSQTIRIRV